MGVCENIAPSVAGFGSSYCGRRIPLQRLAFLKTVLASLAIAFSTTIVTILRHNKIVIEIYSFFRGYHPSVALLAQANADGGSHCCAAPLEKSPRFHRRHTIAVVNTAIVTVETIFEIYSSFMVAEPVALTPPLETGDYGRGDGAAAVRVVAPAHRRPLRGQRACGRVEW